ncbi:MAG: HNH endonuclease signature motif containing protein [Actinomycetota bacterium]
MRERIQELGLDTSHFQVRLTMASFPERDVIEAARVSRSVTRVLARLGIPWSGSRHRTMKLLLERLGVETSHFVGQGWRKGTSSPVVAARPLEDVLVVGRRVQSNHLKERLIREGFKRRRCELCEREDWNGRPIPLELDHVNGRRDDNRLENLRIVCPNCHAQTGTYRGRNIGVGALVP